MRTTIQGGYRRRRALPPRKRSRRLKLLDNLRKQFTLRSILLLVIVAPVLFDIYLEAGRDALVIDPISVPKSFEEAGLTPEVTANRIGDALRQIETSARTRMQRDSLTSPQDEGSIPDVEIPGTNLGLKAIVEITRAVFGIYPKHVSGDIVAFASAGLPEARPKVKISVYITRGRSKSQAISLVSDTEDIDELAQNAAEIVLGQVNPYLLAIYRYDHGDIEKAVEIAEGIIRDPSEDRDHLSAAHNFLGNVLKDQKKYGKAIDRYQKAICLNPKNALAYHNWGLVLLAQKKYDEAIAQMEKAVKLDSNYIDAYNDWGWVLYSEGRYGEAVAKYQKAIKADPNYVLAYCNWGLALSQQGKYGEAIVQYQKAIDLNSKYALAYIDWGLTLSAQEKYGEVAAQYREVIQRDPKNSLAYVRLGDALKAKGDMAGAIAEYEAALRLAPSDADALNMLAWLYATASDAALRKKLKALEYALQAVALDNVENPRHLDVLAEAYYINSDYKNAALTEKRALAFQPDDSARKRFEESLKKYERTQTQARQ